MGETKSALGSAGCWGAVVAGIAALAPLVGYTISSDDQAVLVNLIGSGVLIISNGIALAGAAVALYGRIRATKQINRAA